MPAGRSRVQWLLAGAAGAALALTACGTVRPGDAAGGGRTEAGRSGAGCRTVVHDFVTGPGTLAATWLPAGFRRSRAGRSASGLPSATYVGESARPDPPRLELAVSLDPRPLSRIDAGQHSAVRSVTVQGHPAFLGSGPPGPKSPGVYYEPADGYLISVVGYQLPTRVLLTAARHVSFEAPGAISLPIAPGPVVARKAAVAAARRSEPAAWRHAAAKLSSWTETATVLAAHTGHDVAAAPAALGGGWRPVWTVLLTGPRAPKGATARSAPVVVDATTGKPLFTAAAGTRTRWFAALTDRDRAAAPSGKCPGGSSARLPFGVLTRAEESYAAGAGSTTGSGGDLASTRVVLSTVPAVNKADPGMYGGCVQQNCSIDELVWVEITTERAAPGRTLACLPPSASYPAGYRPKQVKRLFSVNVPDNSEIGCGPVPAPIARLTDLAPPVRG